MRFLLDHGMDVNVVKENGVGPLFKESAEQPPRCVPRTPSTRAPTWHSARRRLWRHTALHGRGRGQPELRFSAAGAGLVNNLTDDGAT